MRLVAKEEKNPYHLRAQKAQIRSNKMNLGNVNFQRNHLIRLISGSDNYLKTFPISPSPLEVHPDFFIGKLQIPTTPGGRGEAQTFSII